MIYLIRHGLDDENYIGGWSNVDLVEEGKKQVKDASNYIVEKGLVINKIISSDIKRAKSTSDIISRIIKKDIVYNDSLRELDKGDYTGMIKKEISINELENINNYNIYSKYPNGESMVDLYNRMKIYLENFKEHDVLLVTHRGVINMFYYILNNIELDMDKEKFLVAHVSVHEMDIEKRLIRRIY